MQSPSSEPGTNNLAPGRTGTRFQRTILRRDAIGRVPGQGFGYTEVMRILPLIMFSGWAATCAAAPDFARDVRPILSQKCYLCHGPDGGTREAELRLDTRDGLFGGNGSTIPVVAGQPGMSELVKRITAEDADTRMPPPDSEFRLTEVEIETLRDWVAAGADWQGHWSFEPVHKPILPDVADDEWNSNAIDRIVFEGLRSRELTPSPRAERHTLIRRLSLDLTGFPPTPREVEDFLNDTSPKAWEHAVDRMLAKRRFGEHMAWWWLDAARYADSDGYESDPLRTMWPWRDWVVEAFNANMSYDQFIIEQLAGDLVEGSNLRTKLASGFNRNHRLNNEGGILPEEWLVEYVCDRTETTATVFMGLTWGCARCHDHKFDPITQADYYSLFAFFNNVPEKGSARGSSTAEPMIHVSRLEHLSEFEQLAEKLAPTDAQLAKLEKSKPFLKRFQEWLKLVENDQSSLPKSLKSTPFAKWKAAQKTAARRHFLTQVDKEGSAIERTVAATRKRYRALERTGAKVMVMGEMDTPRETHILVRGVYNQPADRVEARTPAWLPPMDDDLPRNRLGLARWLTSPDHPLTARVAVNRIWEVFFEVGLVKTQEDFGSQGEVPSNAKLLDWLASEFLRSGWDVKGLIKTILLSRTYQQASAIRDREYAADPENRLIWRAPRYRLPAAAIRDQALALSGLLVDQPGGPPVKPYQPDGLWRDVIKGSPTYKPDSGDALYRRSLYTLWRRALKPPLMMILDSNERDTCRVSQRRTNTPLQALLLLNDVTFVEAARGMAARIIKEAGDSTEDRIRFAMKLVCARSPSDEEGVVFEQVVNQALASFRLDPSAARELVTQGASQPDESIPHVELAGWTILCRVLLNLDEALTRE